MLTAKILHSSAAKDHAHYYSDQKDDYYSKEDEARTWHGNGAARLGLSGEVQVEDFLRLLRGEIAPGQARADTTPGGSKSRSGVDFTFSAPKSVSLQALVGKDARIIAIHDAAVARTIEHMEKDARARMKVQGKSHVELTGNVIAASFRHETARPSPGAPPDPQLHSHAVFMNLTQRADGKWVALQNDELFRSKAKYDAQYMMELAAGLQVAGYQLRWDERGNIELAHFSRDQIEGFSKRSQQIEAHLQAHGLTRMTASPDQKQRANLATRQSKTQDRSRDELRSAWEVQAAELGMDFSRREWAGPGKETGTPSVQLQSTPHEIADAAVVWTVSHLTERNSVMLEKDLIVTALKHAGGKATISQIHAAVSKRKACGHLVHGETRYRSASDETLPALTHREWAMHMVANVNLTEAAANACVMQGIREGRLVAEPTELTTVEHRRREQAILALERAGRNAVEAVLDVDVVRQRMAETSLTVGQRDAVEHILRTTNRFAGVEGHAGTGKTHMLKHMITLAQEQGYTVVAVAPYGNMARELRGLEVESGTVASMLYACNKDRFQVDNKTIVIVDEAGVMPAVDAVRLMRFVEQKGARSILLGDRGQTKAIQAGAPFSQLINAGMATAYMTQIVRQKVAKLRRAVELAAGGRPAASLSLVNQVHAIRSRDVRYAMIARDYAALPETVRNETLVVTGTNQSRETINQEIRKALNLEGTGKKFDLLIRHDSTQVERRHSKYFTTGDVIQPERDYKLIGLEQGETYLVVDNGPGNKLSVRSAGGKLIQFNPAQVKKSSVYKSENHEISVGDWVRATRNFAKQDIANGNRMRVVGINEKSIELSFEGRIITLPTDRRLHLDLAYATTVHSAQGMTYERVMINAETKSLTTKDDVYYVAVSRGRESAVIYTDNRAKLPTAISQKSVKRTALEIGIERNQKNVKPSHQNVIDPRRKSPTAMTKERPDMSKTERMAALEMGR